MINIEHASNMKTGELVFVALLVGMVMLLLAGPTQAQDRASRAIEKRDQDGDGKISRDEWHKSGRSFGRIDTDKDGYLTLDELRARFSGGESKKTDGIREDNNGHSTKFAVEGQTTGDAIDRATFCAMARGRKCGVKYAIERGLFETGLKPRFPDNVKCRSIDDHYAMDYTHKRPRESYHGGSDIPARFGTPIFAAAAGTVVAKYPADNSPRGIEIILRHSPEDTGYPFWIYTQYAHFNKMPKLVLGQRVQMGEVLGPTGNSGLHPRKGGQHLDRRPAIHFAAFFTSSELYVERTRHKENRKMIIPVDFQWMDPLALFRKIPPLDSRSMKALSRAEKKVPIAVKLKDGEVIPADTRIVWPYACKRKKRF